jgi:cytochrome b561
MHFQLGLLILLLVPARLLWRMFDPALKPPAGMSLRLAGTAAVTPLLLFLTVVAMIVSGYIIQVHIRLR